MQKSQSNIIDFFPEWNFNSSLFYLLLPTLKEEEKKELTTLIIKYKGKITFTISNETIIVIENSNILKSKESKEIIKDFDIIYLYDNNFIRKINIKNNNINKKRTEKNIIKIITITALNEEINIFKSKSIDFFYEHGLNNINNMNKNFSPKNVLCLLLKNKNKKTQDLISYNFNNSKKLEENDIPFYHPKAPETFSLFCSEYEYRQIMRHIKTEEYKNQLKEKERKLEEEKIIKTEPEPNKKEFLCQICKSRFDNYLEHIKSNLHMKNKIRYNNTFISIKNTFQRIVDNNKEKEKNKNKNELIIEENNILLISTKEDSVPINEDNNKITKGKKNLEKIMEKNEENDKSQKSEEKYEKDISVKDILNILNTIEIKEINKENKQNINKKRKKGEEIKIWNDNNYIKNMQQVTGKIYYYNKLVKKLEWDI